MIGDVLSIERRNVELLDGAVGVLGRAERKQEIGEAVVVAAELRVAERDGSFGAGRNREDAGFEHAGADPFQQGGVAVLADDLFVAAAGIILREQLGLVFFAVDQQRELVDRSVIRKRKYERGFHRLAAGVLERLRDLDLGDLIVERGVDFEGVDFVGRDGLGHRLNDRSRQADVVFGADIDEDSLGGGRWSGGE